MGFFHPQKPCTTSSIDNNHKNFIKRSYKTLREQNNITFEISAKYNVTFKATYDLNLEMKIQSLKKYNAIKLTSQRLKRNDYSIVKKYFNFPLKILFLKQFTLIIFILQIVSFCITQTIESNKELSVCTRYQACAAEISQFPLLSETVGQIIEINEKEDEKFEGSGQSEGSGDGSRKTEFLTEKTHFPIYDEFVSEPTMFDYNANSEVLLTQICKCPGTKENDTENTDNQCTFDNKNNENIMHVDRTLRLTFCQPINQLFKVKCVGRRALVRVIGKVDLKTGESFASVNDTAVFCRCELPYVLKRVSIEPWLNSYAFAYRCTRP